jgi:hypothetical protein
MITVRRDKCPRRTHESIAAESGSITRPGFAILTEYVRAMKDNNASNPIRIVLGFLLALILVVFLQNAGKTPIRDDHDLPPVTSPRR